tara:strand:- start:110 stop:598 length:489 start_codon:yes stop_codon:yes gene_type:complete
MIEGHKFVDAFFMNEERNIAQSLWVDEEGIERPVFVTADENDHQWKELLTYITIDDLHERTFKRNNQYSRDYKDFVIEMAKENKWIYDLDSLDSEMYKVFAKLLFKPFDPEEDKEVLFLYKLCIFENDVVKNSDNKQLKTKLRKSKTFAEATKHAVEFIENS